MYNFSLSHPDFKAYYPNYSMPGWQIFSDARGWSDHWLLEHLVYSHRQNCYTFSSFPERLHHHDHYELQIPKNGDVAFILDNYLIIPQAGNLVLFKPNRIHTTRLLSECVYERYVFLFDTQAFQLQNIGLNLTFLEQADDCIAFPVKMLNTLYGLLDKLDIVLQDRDSNVALLAYSYIIQIFHLINQQSVAKNNIRYDIPENVLKIKQYMDDNYLNLNTTSEIAAHFFYRREHVSRLFKEYFNTNVSDYLALLKIRHSQMLLENGATVTEACYQSGFHNMSTFTTTFHRLYHTNPSAYRKEILANKKTGR